MKDTTSSLLHSSRYCPSLTAYTRRETIEVKIGSVPMGAKHPIRVQSMTTVDTMDTKGSVEQVIRMVDAGSEYVRITAPSVKEAQNLAEIKKELRNRGYHVPLIADIHFTPNAAELSARIVEKVRINPGNYADKKRFETIEYTEQGYKDELDRIRDKFLPLIRICKEYGTAMRIGTNHGSLSDRIMSRYGDSPLGMVESALEFLQICEDESYFNIVLSMKSSNPQVMVQAYRLLVNRLDSGGFKPYPLHLGVTEAGEAEDGRIKSALGIGTLLEDGLGDTIRVSLTEDPEFEIPVARALVDRYAQRARHKPIKEVSENLVNPFQYTRRKTTETANFGGFQVPRVIADLSHVTNLTYEDLKTVGHFYFSLTDKWNMNDLGCDYLYSGSNPVSFMLPNGLREILDYNSWLSLEHTRYQYPLLTSEEYLSAGPLHPDINFVKVNYKSLGDTFYGQLRNDLSVVLVLETTNLHAMAALRRLAFYLVENQIDRPVILHRTFDYTSQEEILLHASTDTGGLLIDGIGDGIMLSIHFDEAIERKKRLEHIRFANETGFGILQAARVRISKTEYISCPSCGRTLFDLQETTAMIRKRTDHLKGIKIGIMGCIVNGPGEMADADYGYVGVGKDRIALYKGREVVKKAVLAEQALDELISLIKSDGKWQEEKTEWN